MDEGIKVRVEKAVHERVFPGCVIGAVRANGARDIRAFGNSTYEQDSAKVKEDTMYDVASITKSIPTASLAHLFIHERKFSPADRVRKYLSELKNDRSATIEDLLRYRVLGPQMSVLAGKTPEEITAYVFERGFDGPPGASRYTNLPAFILGLIIERVGGKTLDVLAQDRFFEPLRMNRTTFFPKDLGQVAPTETRVQGIVHDESARVFAKMGRAVGHAGLFSSVPDLLEFLEALLKGEYSPVVEGAQKGLGWQLNDPNFMGKYAGPHAFGKTGFTGTSIVCDRECGLAFVILSNRTYPKRPPDDNAIFAFRRDIADIILKNA